MPILKQVGVVLEKWLDLAINLGQRTWIWFVVLFGGLIAGSQIFSPNKRVIQVLAAGLLVAAALRVESLVGLMILIPLIPFPKATSYGSTNVAFVFFIFVIWMVRVVFKREKTAGKTPIDLPVGLLIMAYLLSFSQLDDFSVMQPALINFFQALTFMALCYLAIHLIHDEKQLRKIVWSIIVMAVLIQLSAIFELLFPAQALVPGWIDLSVGKRADYIREGLEITNLRVGGAFQDYELLAEFCAMILILQWFLLMQYKTTAARFGLLALLGLSTFVLFATVTRGAVVSLAVAGGYLLWITRRRIKFHIFVIVSVAVLGGSWLLLEVVTTQTRSGNILERIAGTTFQGGVPDTRQNVWALAWERVWESPIFGHGPYFEHRSGVRQFFWPHNTYLFYWHIVGLVGLAAFLFILYRLWRATRFRASHLGSDSYAKSLLLAIQGMLLLFIVDEIKIDYIRNDIYPYWIWLFFGLVIAASRVSQMEDSKVGTGLTTVTEPEPRVRRIAAVSEISAIQSGTP